MGVIMFKSATSISRAGALALGVCLGVTSTLSAQVQNPVPLPNGQPRPFRGFMPGNPGTPPNDNTGIGVPSLKTLGNAQGNFGNTGNTGNNVGNNGGNVGNIG